MPAFTHLPDHGGALKSVEYDEKKKSTVNLRRSEEEGRDGWEEEVIGRRQHGMTGRRQQPACPIAEKKG